MEFPYGISNFQLFIKRTQISIPIASKNFHIVIASLMMIFKDIVNQILDFQRADLCDKLVDRLLRLITVGFLALFAVATSNLITLCVNNRVWRLWNLCAL